MKWVFRVVVMLFFCFVFFGAIQYFFPFNVWLSAVLALVGALFIALRETFDFVKKAYDARKAPYEFQKIKREEEAAERETKSIVKTATPAETAKFGSVIERLLDERYQKTGRYTLEPTPFVEASHEERQRGA